MAQEAVANAVKHSGARKIAITLSSNENQVCLRIADDGTGFPLSGATAEPASRPAPGPGLGLRIMHHRARMIGAAFELGSRPGGGTVVLCSLRRAHQTAPETVPAYAEQD
jgi:signal transduction histidine kinase